MLTEQFGWPPAHPATAVALTVTWWPGSDDPLVIAEAGPVWTGCPPAGSPPQHRAALPGLGLGLESFGTWDDDVLVVPQAQAVAVSIIGQRLSLFIGLVCWGSCDLPADPLWHRIDTCPVGVMPHMPDRGCDVTQQFVRLLQDGRAVIADAAVLRRVTRSQPRAAA